MKYIRLSIIMLVLGLASKSFAQDYLLFKDGTIKKSGSLQRTKHMWFTVARRITRSTKLLAAP